MTVTDTDMTNIVGPVSILGQICLNVQVTILNDPDLGQKGTSINTFFLEQIQWGSAKVLGNPQITISNIPIVKSIGEFDFDPIFTTQPEFGFYVANNGGKFEDLLTNSQVQIVFANDTSSYQTLLGPDNMRQFYIDYGEKAYGNIMTRFNLSGEAQIDFMYAYLEQMVDDFIMFGGDSYDGTALGMLMSKSLN